MGVFHNFPYVNFHELNLDWILKFTKSVRDRLDTIDAAVANAKNYSQQSEAWAVGTIDGEAVDQLAPQHENNAKWWSDQASESAENASLYDGYAGQSAYDADQARVQAMKWATGTGALPTDPQYENNAKYYADQASGGVGEALEYGVGNAAQFYVSGCEVKAARDIYNSGVLSMSLNIPGLICVRLPYVNTGSTTPDYVNDEIAYRKNANFIIFAHAEVLRDTKYRIEWVDKGVVIPEYAIPGDTSSELSDLQLFTVYDLSTGAYATDGTTLDVSFFVCRSTFLDSGFARNGNEIGDIGFS